ncbi:LANO_0F00540g1_1 [Lachancea nothofagi CBS 11611]|uniref:LANO_0F00540g1_1 n=1 Tax=Lachancea nothofagi CBS 11611 TaxID=1266666 RepID=A0A1G4K5G6_9SACH|nr:LANO_0F00540g1_1 [Lachancea nothofagi CBS 11611]
MVLPIVLGLGVTFAAVTARSGLRAWEVYRRLTPMMIAYLNGIRISTTEAQFQQKNSFRYGRLNDALRSQLDQYGGGFAAKMTDSEALLILGISGHEIESLDMPMLKRKHRRAMVQNHPDRGGSPFLAMKVNEARDVLSHSIMLRK